MFMVNYIWSNSNTSKNVEEISHNIENLEDNFISVKLNRKRSNSYDSFFNESKNNKLNSLENSLKLNKISQKMDELNNKIEFYIKNISYNENNKYKYIVGLCGGIILSFLFGKNIANK